ncbi:AraC family transcriptional regulator [Methyloceanibacter sp.]|uniref:AraC family transcriptional regulator n=1 Tax=Methyloceanibacter sp. TaxID=1965321 RepID=UPI002BE93322|nr:AraC family transcriptional regulator [Methyloceanibacter sp.]HML93036.1 AraC family transcriptional regulator [Methyloceanibacter sp.]
MAAPIKKKPLDRFPVVRTSDIDEMRAAVSQFYGDLRFSVRCDFGNFRAHGNHCQLKDVGISYATYGATVDQFYPHFASGYAVTIAASGSGWGRAVGKAVGIDGQQALIASPGMPAELHCNPDIEEITVLLRTSAVEQKLGGLIGADIKGNLVFDPALDFDKPVNQLWWRLLQFLICEAESRQVDLPLTALNEIEQALIVMFLKTNPHNFSHLLDRRPRDVAPLQVRLAEAYIEAHWNEPITVEKLAQLTNVSVRSLFHSFRKTRGYSPMAFVKQARLRHARQMLLTAEPRTTVASVACKCGFGNLGNFARDYHKAFGELPSDTLRTTWGTTFSFSLRSD